MPVTVPRTRLGLVFATLLAALAPHAHAQTPDAATLKALKWRSIGPVNMAGRITETDRAWMVA